MRVTQRGTEIRDGYFRAGVSYPHPILWGLICTLLLAQAWYLWCDRTLSRLQGIAVAVASTLTAMSSAPILALGVQTSLILWGRLTGNRWWLLTILFSAAYVTVDLLSNRGPVIIMIETLTLNPQTAWWRVYIWQYGSESVMNHPVLGIGLNDWVRPEWLAPTVDNFWLLIAMRHGFPAILLLCSGLSLHLWHLIRASGLSPDDLAARMAYIIALAALCFILCTVHVWGSPSVLVMFYFGMGSFLYTGGGTPTAATGTIAAPDYALALQSQHSRFAVRQTRGTKIAAKW
jgi:hypothetical protein